MTCITEAGKEADSICLIAHGKVNKIGTGKYGEQTVLEVLADGDHYSYEVLLESQDYWQFTVKAVTSCTVLILQQSAFEAVVAQAPSLQKHIEDFKALAKKKQDKSGQADIELAAGHHGRARAAGHLRGLRDLAPRVRAERGPDRAPDPHAASPTCSTTR